MSALSIIVPTLNEAETIGPALVRLAPLRACGVEVIVADGGSLDGTGERAREGADRTVEAPRGRGSQMNAGAKVSTGDVLLFLHADTELPQEADRLILDGLARSGHVWGRFDVRIAGRGRLLRLVAFTMNMRSRATGIATGDQAMFVRRSAFQAVGGFEDIPLMEDIALSRRLKRRGPPLCLSARVTTSGRRWDQRGALRTILLMWGLRLRYVLGASPNRLARRYGYVPRES